VVARIPQLYSITGWGILWNYLTKYLWGTLTIMKKYKCSCTGIDYYQTTIIEAENEEMAKDKYAEMVELGEILAVDYDYTETIAEEVAEGGMDK
jgi:hypothetical protein